VLRHPEPPHLAGMARGAAAALALVAVAVAMRTASGHLRGRELQGQPEVQQCMQFEGPSNSTCCTTGRSDSFYSCGKYRGTSSCDRKCHKNPWEMTCPEDRPCPAWETVGGCSCWRCLPKGTAYRVDTPICPWWEDAERQPRTNDAEWQREFEALGGGANAACRGDNASDGGAYGVDYDLFDPVFGEESCRQMCMDREGCSGIEFNELMLMCKIWLRPSGLHAWASPDESGYTCARYGWPTRYLHPMDGGEGRACRGDTAADNSEDYYTVRILASFEECRAACSASAVCAGIEFHAETGRCEVWHREIFSSIPRANYTCLRYDPSLPVHVGTTVTTTPSPLRLVTLSVGPGTNQKDGMPMDTGCKELSETVLRCENSASHVVECRASGWSPYWCGTYSFVVTVQGEHKVCVTRMSGGSAMDWAVANFEVPVTCQVRSNAADPK